MSEVKDVSGVTAVLTAEAASGRARRVRRSAPAPVASLQEHRRVQEARAKGAVR